MSELLLEVNGLKTYFKKKGEYIKAIDDVSFHINKGEILGVVGESGCGKSVTALSIMGLLPEASSVIAGGSIIFDGDDILTKTEREMCNLRGNDISMIFQEPMTSLNPVFKCGDQIAESIIEHLELSKDEAMKRAIELLGLVGIPDPEKRAEEYPHQLSGGMRQRVMIAMALACDPKLLIADEPTTALDVTIQAQILELLRKIRDELGMSIMLITHDLGVVAEMADRVLVMYSGKIVEEAVVDTIFSNPIHPYTEGLLDSIPKIESKVARLNVIEGVVPNPLARPIGCNFCPRCKYAVDICYEKEPVLERVDKDHSASCWLAEERLKTRREEKISSKEKVEMSYINKDILLRVRSLKKYYPLKKGFLSKNVGYVKAVDDVSFDIYRGEVFGLVGESGCGKTTLGKTILRLIDATEGEILFEGKDILKLKDTGMKQLRKDIQVIFQDPYASLNPRMTVRQIVSEPMIINNILPKDKVMGRTKELLEVVGLSDYHLDRYPHEFSGGQRQRIGIARALSLNPKIIICDEPVSALDVSIQSQILNLLKDLQAQFELSYIFIAHGLSVVKHVSDRVGVMYLGKLVELTRSEELYSNPLHPYTKALISAIPVVDPKTKEHKRIILEGDVPSPINPPKGCRFNTRCSYAMDICKDVEPLFREVGDNHFVACHLYW